MHRYWARAKLGEKSIARRRTAHFETNVGLDAIRWRADVRQVHGELVAETNAQIVHLALVELTWLIVGVDQQHVSVDIVSMVQGVGMPCVVEIVGDGVDKAEHAIVGRVLGSLFVRGAEVELGRLLRGVLRCAALKCYQQDWCDAERFVVVAQTEGF